jgi:hypothetical protein
MKQNPIAGAFDAIEKLKNFLNVLNIRLMNVQVFKNLCLFVAEMTKYSQINIAHLKQIDTCLDFLAEHFKDIL